MERLCSTQISSKLMVASCRRQVRLKRVRGTPSFGVWQIWGVLGSVWNGFLVTLFPFPWHDCVSPRFSYAPKWPFSLVILLPWPICCDTFTVTCLPVTVLFMTYLLRPRITWFHHYSHNYSTGSRYIGLILFGSFRGSDPNWVKDSRYLEHETLPWKNNILGNVVVK